MVWAAVWVDERGRGRRSPLVLMDRDTNAPKSGYFSKSYIKALTKGLSPKWRNSHQFMHDNAAIHTSLKVREFLTDHHIQPIIWPPYSPDLNPIEHLWWCSKSACIGTTHSITTIVHHRRSGVGFARLCTGAGVPYLRG
jgi:hypothetical protein